jgi:hypothetical protein
MERQVKIIEHDLNFYKIEQDLFESDELFYGRINYIKKNLKENNLDELIKISRLISNSKNYGCEYNSNIKNMMDI